MIESYIMVGTWSDQLSVRTSTPGRPIERIQSAWFSLRVNPTASLTRARLPAAFAGHPSHIHVEHSVSTRRACLLNVVIEFPFLCFVQGFGIFVVHSARIATISVKE
jgi:hypothetical protein